MHTFTDRVFSIRVGQTCYSFYKQLIRLKVEFCVLFKKNVVSEEEVYWDELVH